MIGRSGVRGYPAFAGLLMITSLVVVQGLQAAAVRACPHHSGSDHAAESAGHAGASMAPTAAPDSPRPEHHAPHGAPCNCLGPCGATSLIQAPPVPGESVFSQVAPRRIPLADQVSLVSVRWILPFALPYPNAPPV